jgi:DNA-directed RNA polymerase specialized sigma24 family protein
MTSRGGPEPPTAPAMVPQDVADRFGVWFRGNFAKLTRDLMTAGADFHEAQDAAADAAADLLSRWTEVDHPYAYARRTAIHSLIKRRERGPRRLQGRMIARGDVMSSGEDPGLTAWEDQEWVTGLLKSLPAGQREVIACIVDDFTPAEAAQLLGRTPAAARRALADARIRLKRDLASMTQNEVIARVSGKRRSTPAAVTGIQEAR